MAPNLATIRVLVVEDSVTVRRRICEVLGSAEGFEVVGEAADGKRAIELCAALRPDVIAMDMMLPVMTGLAATEYIMAHFPTPILIVSSSTNRGELFKTYDALAAGAVDVLEKPTGEEPEGVWEDKLFSALRIVARVRVITHLRARLKPPRAVEPAPAAEARRPITNGRRIEVVMLGASTGGPGALADILAALPAAFDLPILLVLHIGEKFGGVLAEWLDGQSARRVAYAVDGASVGSAAGRVVMAPPGRHLVVRGGRMYLTREAERHSCRPSVDVLFESAARECGPSVAACLLTGMGRDGASGLVEVRRAGGLTIAQDETTSVIYGMPREAVALGGVEHVLPLGEIGPALAALGLPRGERLP
jgi:two-component system chemotaxis response regulator CheB